MNSNTNLLSIDYITRTHTQMRKNPRGEKESGKEERDRKKKKENIEKQISEKIRKKEKRTMIIINK